MKIFKIEIALTSQLYFIPYRITLKSSSPVYRWLWWTFSWNLDKYTKILN